jgi:hypothetical protein
MGGDVVDDEKSLGVDFIVAVIFRKMIRIEKFYLQWIKITAVSSLKTCLSGKDQHRRSLLQPSIEAR